MVSVYVKALIITIVIFVGNFFFIKYLDDSAAADLNAQLEKADEEIQSASVLLLYSQAFNNSPEICPLLEKQTNEQVNRLYDLFNQLQEVSNANVFTDTTRIKNRFILSNAELFLYATQLKKTCGSSGMDPVLYFYPDKQDCIECRGQAQILDKLRDDCKNIRIFAFPTDLNIGIVDALKQRYSISQTPSIVVADKTFGGITSREQILELVPCA